MVKPNHPFLTTPRRRGAFNGRSRETMTSLSRDIGPCVYFIRTKDGLIKIGHTGSIAGRKRAFGPGWQHVLAIVPGTLDDEHAFHVQFADLLARGKEYFRPAPDLLACINEIRERLHVPAISA